VEKNSKLIFLGLPDLKKQQFFVVALIIELQSYIFSGVSLSDQMGQQ